MRSVELIAVQVILFFITGGFFMTKRKKRIGLLKLKATTGGRSAVDMGGKSKVSKGSAGVGKFGKPAGGEEGDALYGFWNDTAKLFGMLACSTYTGSNDCWGLL